jgi:hypothetical protein
MSTKELDAILSKEQYERRRTRQQLSEYVESVHSRLRETGKAKYGICGNGIGKKFIKEMHPLNLFAQSYFRDTDDVSFVVKFGDESFDGQIFKGEQELCKIQITEAIDGPRWGLQKELLLENGWAPGTGKIRCSSRKHNRKKGDIKATSEWVDKAQTVKEELSLIKKALDKKFSKSDKASGLYGRGTWLLVVFDDTTVLHPDELRPDDRNSLLDLVRQKASSVEPSFDKVFLIGWSGESLYESDVDNRRA